jgi:hypothetical protein
MNILYTATASLAMDLFEIAARSTSLSRPLASGQVLRRKALAESPWSGSLFPISKMPQWRALFW